VIELSAKTETDSSDFHKLWDKCVNTQEAQMREKWFERHLIPLSNTASNFHVKKIQCSLLLQARVKSMCFEISEVTPAKHEQWLRSKDGLVVGCADEIRYEGPGEGATLIDYKTGRICEDSAEGEILPQYKDQLMLYAALFYEETDQWPARLMITGLDGSRHLVDFEKKDCLALLELSKEVLSELNRRIENETDVLKLLANPAQENCQYCLYRPICKSYFLQRKGNKSVGWNSDVWGILEEKKVLLNGLGKISLIPLSGGVDNQMRIRSLQLRRHPALESCQTIGVFSLFPDGSSNCFTEGKFTTIYGTEICDFWS
jgi:CRISPR/Cas system-associated exonuclease Cas4 (RecB family)